MASSLPPRLPLELLLEIVSNVSSKTFVAVLYSSRSLALGLLASTKLRRQHPTLLDQLHLAIHNKSYLLSVLLPHTSVSADRGALQSAAAVGALDAVRVLLAHGAELYPSVGKTQSALTVAARNGHGEVVRLLLAHPRAEYSPEALCAAAGNGHTLVVAVLLADARQAPRLPDLQRALCRAAASGVVAIVTLLLLVAESRGTPLDLARADDEDGTPLQVAAKHGRSDMVRWLLEQDAVRAAIDAQAGNSGRTALHFAGVSLLRPATPRSISSGPNTGLRLTPREVCGPLRRDAPARPRRRRPRGARPRHAARRRRRRRRRGAHRWVGERRGRRERSGTAGSSQAAETRGVFGVVLRGLVVKGGELYT